MSKGPPDVAGSFTAISHKNNRLDQAINWVSTRNVAESGFWLAVIFLGSSFVLVIDDDQSAPQWFAPASPTIICRAAWPATSENTSALVVLMSRIRQYGARGTTINQRADEGLKVFATLPGG